MADYIEFYKNNNKGELIAAFKSSMVLMGFFRLLKCPPGWQKRASGFTLLYSFWNSGNLANTQRSSRTSPRLSSTCTAGLRRFQIDIDQLRLDELQLEVVIESDQVELERLRLDLARSESLLERGLVDVGSTESLGLRVREIETRLVNNRELLEQTQARRFPTASRPVTAS